MKKRIRILLAVIILVISFTLLFWGYIPNPRETLTQPIVPAEMQLP